MFETRMESFLRDYRAEEVIHFVSFAHNVTAQALHVILQFLFILAVREGARGSSATTWRILCGATLVSASHIALFSSIY